MATRFPGRPCQANSPAPISSGNGPPPSIRRASTDASSAEAGTGAPPSFVAAHHVSLSVRMTEALVVQAVLRGDPSLLAGDLHDAPPAVRHQRVGERPPVRPDPVAELGRREVAELG